MADLRARVVVTRAWSLPACGLAACLPPPLAASDELDVYGRVNLTVGHADEAGEEQFELRNNASRIGVKGELALDSGLKAIYQLEWSVNIDSDGDEDEDDITPRNQFVGLEGGFGTVKVGRHDTALKEAQGDFDLFDDLEGDIERVFNGENRLTDYIGYVSPEFAGGLSVLVNFFPGEDPAGGNDGAADSTSASLVYATDPVYVAVAYDSDIDGEDVQTLRAVGGYTLGEARLMLLYQRTEAGGLEEDGFGASLAWTFGKYIAKFQYLAAGIWRIRPDYDPIDRGLESLFSVGLDRMLGEETRLFGFYTTGDIGGASESVGYAAIGIEHKF